MNLNYQELFRELTRYTKTHPYLFARIHKYQIAPNVEYVKYWPLSRAHSVDPQIFFLIRSQHHYVGIVTLNHNELCCFALSRFRNTELMFQTLRTAVLPFLFLHEEHQQLKISLKEDYLINKYAATSNKTLLKLGFKETKKDEFLLSRVDSDFTDTNLDFQHQGMDLLEFEAAKYQLTSIAKKLLQLRARLEAAYGRDSSDLLLTELSQQVRDYQNILVARAVAFHKNEAHEIEGEGME